MITTAKLIDHRLRSTRVPDPAIRKRAEADHLEDAAAVRLTLHLPALRARELIQKLTSSFPEIKLENGQNPMPTPPVESPVKHVRYPDQLKVGKLLIDPARREVSYNRRKLPALTYTEFELIYFLARHPNFAFDREQIAETVIGVKERYSNRSVDVHITALRRKLGPARKYIKTVFRVGYLFDSTVK